MQSAPPDNHSLLALINQNTFFHFHSMNSPSEDQQQLFTQETIPEYIEKSPAFLDLLSAKERHIYEDVFLAPDFPSFSSACAMKWYIIYRVFFLTFSEQYGSIEETAERNVS
jgi:hypothetical protein